MNISVILGEKNIDGFLFCLSYIYIYLYEEKLF